MSGMAGPTTRCQWPDQFHLPAQEGTSRGLTAKVLSFLQTCIRVATSETCRLGNTRPKSSSGSSSSSSRLGSCLSAGARHRCFPDRRKVHSGARAGDNSADAIEPGEWTRPGWAAQCWPVVACALSRPLCRRQCDGLGARIGSPAQSGVHSALGTCVGHPPLEYICMHVADILHSLRTGHTTQRTDIVHKHTKHLSDRAAGNRARPGSHTYMLRLQGWQSACRLPRFSGGTGRNSAQQLLKAHGRVADGARLLALQPAERGPQGIAQQQHESASLEQSERAEPAPGRDRNESTSQAAAAIICVPCMRERSAVQQTVIMPKFFGDRTTHRYTPGGNGAGSWSISGGSLRLPKVGVSAFLASAIRRVLWPLAAHSCWSLNRFCCIAPQHRGQGCSPSL